MRRFYIPAVFLFALLILNFSPSPNRLLLNTASQALLTVIPNAYSSISGGLTFTGPLANTGRTYQWVIHQDQLTNLQYGHQINSISLRLPVSASANWPASDVTFSNFDIYLSKSVDPADRSLTFANNIVGTQTQVRSGGLTITANSYTFGSDPNSFGPEITFTTPYIYTGGNLLIELRHNGFTGTTSSIDAIGTAVTGYGTQFSACGTTGYTATSGSQNNFSVVRINTDPLPGPNISYSELLNTGNTGNRQLTATIISPSGVVLGPNGPRLYYKKSTDGSYIFDNNPSVSGNDFTFTINTASLGGVSAGTIIQYYIAAQDITGEARTNPFGGSGVNPPGTTPPGNPNQYTIVNSFSGPYTIGAAGNFPTIGAAITAISTGEVSGQVFFNLIDGSYTGETFPIVLPEVLGMSATNTVTFRPASGVNALIHNSAGTGLFTFSGGDYYRINGNNPTSDGLESLTLRNGGSVATASGLLFQNDASYNIIDGCIIESDMTSTTLGAIHFGTSAGGTTGNDFNTITNCEIRHISTSANSYSNGIYSSGTTANSNSDNTISNNKIYNFTNAGLLVSATGNGDNWTISGNNLFNNYSTPPSTSQTAINFIPGTNSNSNIISSNNIGGSAINCGGAAWVNTGNVTITCISTNVGTTGVTRIHSNTIKNINMTGVGTAAFNGVSCVTNGLVEVGIDGANNIGGPTAGEQIRNAGNSTLIGISSSVGSAGGITISNNVIQNLYSSGTGTGIGNRGISHTGAGNFTVSNNTIMNNKSDASTSSDATSSVLGIYTSSSNTSQLIERNTIFGLEATNTSAAVTSQGIITTTSTSSGTVSRNRIYGLKNGSTLPNADIFGIHFLIGQWSAINNQVTLDQNTSGCRNVGIYDSSSTTARNTFYLYNTVYITGTNDVASTTNSYAFLRSNSATTVYLRNNLFYNQRTGGTGFHYAIGNNVATPSTGWGVQASEFNFLVSPDASRIGQWGATNCTFAVWKATANCDFISMSFLNSEIPSSVFSNASSGNLNINASNANSWYLNGSASQITTPSVSVDFDGDSRSVTVAGGSTDIGSDEFTPSGAPPVINLPVSVGNNDISIGGKPIGIINVINNGGGSLTSVNLQYYSGINPPNSAPMAKYGNGYISISPNGGASGYQYNITFNYIDEILGTITAEGDIRLAKSNDGGSNWITYLTPGTGTDQYQLDMVNNTITVYGLTSLSLFALTDANAALPVELSSFSASINRRDVNLSWITASERNNSGFNVERKAEGSEIWSELGFVNGNGTTSEPKNYLFTDRGLNTGKYNYRLKQVDYNGNFEYFNLSSEVIIGVPEKFDLSQNYPNPFNPVTKINFDLPFDSKVTLKIYDITGREIKTLINDVQSAGYYTLQFDASALSSGVYFYRISAEGGNQNFLMTKKMMLVK